MAESSLSVTYADLKEATAQLLGYGRTSGNWTTRQTTNIEDAVKRGLRMFYYPHLVLGEKYQHEWRFLRPIRTINVWPTTTTAAITVSGGGNTILTAASGTPFHASMIGKTIYANSASGSTWVSNGNGYVIDGYTSTTVITVATDASADTGRIFRITADGDYRMPDDFQDIDGPIFFTSTDQWKEMEVGGETQVLRQRQYDSTTGIPSLAAITQEEYDDDNATRFNLMIFPIPDAVYTLRYRSWIAPGFFSSDTDYPAGGAIHAETMYAACLAGAELEVDQRKGPNWENFTELLRASISRDRQANTPESLGVLRDMGNYDGSDVVDYHGPNLSARVTYEGTLYTGE